MREKGKGQKAKIKATTQKAKIYINAIEPTGRNTSKFKYKFSSLQTSEVCYRTNIDKICHMDRSGDLEIQEYKIKLEARNTKFETNLNTENASISKNQFLENRSDFGFIACFNVQFSEFEFHPRDFLYPGILICWLRIIVRKNKSIFISRYKSIFILTSVRVNASSRRFPKLASTLWPTI
jgi:hypothetical protein